MKRAILSLIFTCGLAYVATAQVGIDTSTPHSSAMMHLESSDKGFLPPRLDESQKQAITNPSKGLVIYNTDLKCLETNIGDATTPEWTCMSPSSGPVVAPLATPANTVAGYTSNNSGIGSFCQVTPPQVSNADPDLSTFLKDSDLATGYASTTKTTGNHVQIEYAEEVHVTSVVVGFGHIPCFTYTNARRRITDHVLEYYDEDTAAWVTIEDGFDDTNTPSNTIRTITLPSPITAKRFRLGAMNTSSWIRISEFYLQ